MSYYSRTALRELKKRYLNILKKCFLANLMAFSFVLPLQAETTEPTLTPSEELETVVYDSSNFSSTTISSDTTIDLAGKNLTYSGITSSSDGGVFSINSEKKLGFINSDETTAPLLLFENNKADSYGGAIDNSGTITFGEDSTVTFTGNTSSYQGGAILNRAAITFGKNSTATFTGNSASSYGGAIDNNGSSSKITFNGDASFTGNSASSSGGAIYNNGGTITFGGDATFTNNTSSSSRGGAIFNDGTITFGGDTTFTNNSASNNGGVIYNVTNRTITFGEGSSVYFNNNTTNGVANDIYNSGTINILGEVKTDIHLVSKGGTIGLKAKDTDGDGKVNYGGSYKLTNTKLDLSGDGAKEVTIENLTVSGSSTLKWDAEITDTGDSYSVASDIKNLTATGQFTAGTMNIMGANKGEWYDVTYNKSLFTDGSVIGVETDGLYKTKNIANGISINFVNVTLPKTLGEVLRSTTASSFDLSQYNLTVDEGETLNYGISEKDLQNGSMGELGSGQKTIIGATDKASDTIINANGVSNLFDLYSGDKLTLENLTISNAKGTIYNDTGSVTLNNVAFTGSTNRFEGGVIYNRGGTITSNKGSSFIGNSISQSGGAIRNSGTITFGGEATFTGNSASSYGGAIYNENGIIMFGDNFIFNGNKAGYGNGKDIYNKNGIIKFGHENSKVGILDGGIYQYSPSDPTKINKTGGGTLILGDNMENFFTTSNAYKPEFNQSAGLTIAHVNKMTFAATNNITGGELRVHGNSLAKLKATVSGDTLFTYLTTNTAEQTVGLGGVTMTSGTLTFGAYTADEKSKELALVADKVVPELDADGNIVYNQDGSIKYVAYDAAGKLLTTDTIDRAKYKLASDITVAKKVVFKDSDVNIESDTYNNNYYFENARIYNLFASDITFGESSTLSFSNNRANELLKDIYNNFGTINILGTVESDIHLISSGGTIGLKAKDTDGDGKVIYGGSYDLSSTTLDLSGDGVKEITIKNLTVDGSSTLKGDAEITDSGDSYSVASDIKNLTATGQFTTGIINVMGGNKGEWYDVTYNKSLFADGSVINVEVDGLYKTKDITNGISINFVDVTLPKTLGEVLRSTTASSLDFGDYITLNEGETINYGISEKDLQNGSMGELGSGQKTIIGATDEAEGTVINGNGVETLFALGSDSKLTFENLTLSNASTVIYNQGSLTLNNVDFKGNFSTGWGYGPIYNDGGTITFNGNTAFLGNSAGGEDGYGGSVYNYEGTITFNGNAIFKNNSGVGWYAAGGAVYNWDVMTFNGDAIFENNSAISEYWSSGGAVLNYWDLIFNGDAIFKNNMATGPDSNEGGAFTNEYDAVFNGDAIFENNSLISTKSGAWGGAVYNYDGTIAFNGNAIFEGNAVTGASYAYGGAIYNSYATITFGENSSVYFSNNKANGKLNDIDNYKGIINILGEVKSDIHLISSDGTIGLKAKDTDGDGKVNYGGSYSLENGTLDISGDGIKEITIENLTGSGSALKLDVLMNQSEDGTITLEGDKVISDSDYTFTDVYLGIIENIVLNQPGDMTPTIDQQTITVLGGNVTFKDGIRSSSTLLTTSPYVYEMTASGQDLTVSASKLADGITSMQYLTTYAGDSTLQMADDGEGASYNMIALETTSPLATGSKAILGASSDAGESIINGNGLEVFMLDKQETELSMSNLTISGAKEVINNQAGVVSLNNVVIKETAGDNAIVNVGNLNLKDVMIDKGVDNSGVIVGEGVVSLAGLTGNGTLSMNEATLDVMDKFATTNKVISNNMKIGEEVQEISFGELEIMAGTTLDIDNKHVTAGKVTFGEEATLSVTLNHLKDYGTLTHEEVVGDETAKLNLKLTNGIDTELGIYQVFNKDNNLVLEENKLIDVIDMQDGSYKVAKKSVEDLSKELGATKEESTVANALLSGNSDNNDFKKVQTDLLDGLQSNDTATFTRAKKALTALSGRSTSLYQSQATAGFTQLHNVVSQMLMNTAAPVFGHNGGEEPARASVYIKGLYDRVNSLTGDGFRMRSKGAVLGVQSAVTEDLTVGVGYAGVDTTAKEPLRRTEVKTNTGFISAQYQPNNWWVSGVVSYSRSQYDEEKHVLSSTGKANYDVDSLGAQITTGYNIKKGKVIVTPEVGIRYLNARQEGYQDSLGTTVEATNSDFVTTMAGFKVGADLGWVRPLAGVMVGYDVITDDISSVNTLANGVTYTINGKALDRLSTTVVAGFGMDIGENATLKLEYNGNYRKEYLDHSGMIRLEYKF